LIRDLNQSHADGPLVRETQVCIIGGGTAGIFLGQELRRHRIGVVILEAGDTLARKPDQVDQYCIQRGIQYRGAELGRSFGLGGTSVLWGGQMIPLTRSDISNRPEVGLDAWPIDYSELQPYFAAVRQQFELASLANATESIDPEFLKRRFPELVGFGDDFELRLSEWLPFGVRNFAKAFAHILKTDDGLEVWINSSVVEIGSLHGQGQRIDSVTAKSPDGRTLRVKSQFVIVCAGALESTRLLLAFDESTNGIITRGGAPLGRNFADHLSFSCGRFVCSNLRRYNMAVAPIFASGIMRTPRLELSADAQRRLRVTSAFAHFAFVTHGDSGFDVVREVLRRRQGEKQRLQLSPVLLGRVVTDVAAMAFWRGVYRRLQIPRRADLLLQVDIEQAPNRNSRLYLSDERDHLRRKRLVIDWRIKPEDLRVIAIVAERILSVWRSSPLDQYAELSLNLPDEFNSFDSLYDIYHPTGSLGMGHSGKTSVVNKDLRLWSVKNCYVSTTAVFPSAGSANPGLTHLALTQRLADKIEKYFG